MNSLSAILKEIRLELGYESAKAFFRFLVSNGSLDFNYSYYSRIEKSTVLPSSHAIEGICSALRETHKEKIILAYCSTLFPQSKYLFRETSPTAKLKSSQNNAKVEEKRQGAKSSLKSDVRVLTLRQVATISISKLHYQLFLILTVARAPIILHEIEILLNSNDLQKIKKSLGDLEQSRLIRLDREQVTSIATDLKFPSKNKSKELIEIYQKLDSWDKSLAIDLNFKLCEERFFFRRVSPRFMSLLKMQCQFLYELVRTSEESDPKYNDDVIQFSLHLSSGRLPG